MICVEELRFSYGKKQPPFIDGMNFKVEKGEIFGFLGPSGAGKSTLQKILTGQLKSYNGYAVVGGKEVKKHTRSFYEEIGVDFEFPSLYEKLTARENLDFFASLYKKKGRTAKELLEEVGLIRDADKKVGMYSKGMKSRLNFIKSLLHEPALLFLDEPTSGLDPSNARIMKDMILKEKEKGKTIILTTHNLIMRKGAAKITYSWIENGSEKTGSCNLTSSGQDGMLTKLISDGKLLTIHSGEPTLNEIFMDVTGRTLV